MWRCRKGKRGCETNSFVSVQNVEPKTRRHCQNISQEKTPSSGPSPGRSRQNNSAHRGCLRDTGAGAGRDQWLAAARAAAPINACDVGGEGDAKVYVRESLTPTTAFLLWKAKKELKGKALCKYVWCRYGVIKLSFYVKLLIEPIIERFLLSNSMVSLGVSFSK